VRDHAEHDLGHPGQGGRRGGLRPRAGGADVRIARLSQNRPHAPGRAGTVGFWCAGAGRAGECRSPRC
jgi:hypothetical protein